MLMMTPERFVHMLNWMRERERVISRVQDMGPGHVYAHCVAETAYKPTRGRVGICGEFYGVDGIVRHITMSGTPIGVWNHGSVRCAATRYTQDEMTAEEEAASVLSSRSR